MSDSYEGDSPDDWDCNESVAEPLLGEPEDELVLRPLRTTTYTRHGMQIIASQPRPTRTTYTINTTTNTTPEEAAMHEDKFAAREADDAIGLIQSWLGGHAPGSTHVPIDAIARTKARAAYGPERGSRSLNITNAARAFRKVIVARCAKDDMTRLPEMTVVINTSEYVPPQVAWLNCDTQVRFFTLTDLDTTVPALAGHPVEVVAVLFSPVKFRPFTDGRTGEVRQIPSDWDERGYVEVLGCWQHMSDAMDARDRLDEAVRAQIAASVTADLDEYSDVEYEDDEPSIVRTYYTPAEVLGSA